MLASALASGASIVSADVVLDGGQTLVGSFTVDGLTFAVNEAGVTLVSVDPSAILGGDAERSGASGEALEVERSLSIPPSVPYAGVAYDVTAIGPYAFYLSGATSVELPATVADVDERTFRSSDVAWAGVDPANGTYASYDGILYDATLSRLLLIPGGRQGAVRISDKAEGVDAPAFSHCAGVNAISVDAGSAHLSSWDGLLYDATGTTLLRVPAGAVDITIREGCTTIASGAMAGCAKLERINAPSTVTSISPDVFEDVPTVSLPVSTLASGDAPAQLNAMVALSSTDGGGLQIDPSSITVDLPGASDGSSWQALGIAVELQEPLMIAEVQSANTYKGAYIGTCTLYANGENAYLKKRGSWSGQASSISEPMYGSCAIDGGLGVMVVAWFNAQDQWTSVQPERKGYRCSGWKGTFDFAWGLNQQYKPTGSFTEYAQWKANDYTIGFDVNGGTGNVPGNISATYDQSHYTTAPTLNKAGYTFDGWATTESGPKDYEKGGPFKNVTAAVDGAVTLYAHWSGNTITCSWNSQGGSTVSNTSATYSETAKVPMPASNPTKAGYVFAGWWSAASGGTEVTSSAALPTSNPTYYAHWTPVISADVPATVTARIDKLGIEEQEEASGYIESFCGDALKVTDAEFEPLAGAATLFGTDTGNVSLVGFPGTSATPLFTFALDTEGAESNAGALSPLTMASYGTRIPIRYHFDIPDELLPALTETTLPVCQVSYTVALA